MTTQGVIGSYTTPRNTTRTFCPRCREKALRLVQRHCLWDNDSYMIRACSESRLRVIYLLWSSPVLVAVFVVVSGVAPSSWAGLCGALVASGVALAASPSEFGIDEELLAAARGAWLSWLVGSVILGGLFFREAVFSDAGPASGDARQRPRRREVFAACFLLGPFAEAATGFGVGQVTVSPILQRLGLSPVHVVSLGLLSQVMVPWGALANGTVIGAQLSGLSPRVLGVHSALLTMALLPAWLLVYWRLSRAAGLRASPWDGASELCWIMAAGALLIMANDWVGPEVAGLMALGPLLVLRFVMDERPDRQRLERAAWGALPYAVLILGLALSRAVPAVVRPLAEAAAVRPFADGPIWSPLMHPASWLLAVGTITGLLKGGAPRVVMAARQAWLRGRTSVLSIVSFMIMAELLTHSGIAAALANGVGGALGSAAVLGVPFVAALFGFLTSSSSTSNGLLMPSQAALAVTSGRSLEWTAAIQNTAAAAATMLSPVRMSMGCALVGKPGSERAVYASVWLLGAAALFVLSAAAALLVV